MYHKIITLCKPSYKSIDNAQENINQDALKVIGRSFDRFPDAWSGGQAKIAT